uniref:Uncharacterized protein n=1 Tax=Anguilla anguilla TaxID=7936 RepID=A0A0E9SFV9_ANGAN
MKITGKEFSCPCARCHDPSVASIPPGPSD